MDSRRRPRIVENATNQSDVAVYNQDVLPWTVTDGRDCGSCGQLLGSRLGVLDNWGAFPAGVKFDPSDEELLQHLRAEIGSASDKSHPLIKSFIQFLDGEDGICQTHPEHLPGVKRDGSSRHFFHRPAKAYTTGTRKRRKIHSEDDEQGVETRWHKTGKTRPVSENGQILGWKKIMVLYRNTGTKKSKPEKTNWILHQYHLGENEEETDGELVVCKVFYQKQPRQCTGGRQAEGAVELETVDLNQGSRDVSLACVSEVSRGTPVTPKVDTPHRPRSMRPSNKEIFPDGAVNMRGALTQSSKGSELTFIGMDTHAALASELTSAPIIQRDQAMVPGMSGSIAEIGQISSELLKAVNQTVHEGYSTEWNNAPYEEGSTSGKSCQNENENLVGPIVFGLREEDGPHQPIPFLACDSQHPYDYGDMDFMDLLCDEELGGESFRCDTIFNSESGSPDEACVTNPNEDYPAIDDILTDTPPALDMELVLSSQEVMDVLYNTQNIRKSCTSLDNDDSLSST